MSSFKADFLHNLHADMKTVVPPEGKVELSVVERGLAESMPQKVMAFKYVAAGTEVYRYAGRTHRVVANSFLALPEGHHGEATLDRRDGMAVGICVYLPAQSAADLPPGNPLDAPVVFPAWCSVLGRVLTGTHTAMMARPLERAAQAHAVLRQLEAGLDDFLAEASATLDTLTEVKRSTRIEHLRRLNLARHHLHDVTDRSVPLAELARKSQMSRFQLTRLFAQVFGEPPASYHRRIRLEAARADLRRDTGSCLQVAHRYGFADNAHFSRAFKRQFGIPPSLAA